MPSTPWHPARLSRALLIVGACALALAIPAGAMHVACDHAEEGAGQAHHCAICRHLQDATPLPVAVVVPAAPVRVAPALPAPIAPALSSCLPPVRGRAPPPHAPVS